MNCKTAVSHCQLYGAEMPPNGNNVNRPLRLGSWRRRLQPVLRLLATLILMGGATVGSLRAALVTTQPANAIRVTSAALNGMVVPGPNSTAAWFEWGTSSSYGNTAGTNNLPAGSRVVPVKQVLIGLSADPVYHFRLVASNLLGVVYGADQQFTLGASVVVWGNGGFGQIPAPSDLTNAVAIGGGGYHCAALRNDGTIAAWGGDAHGQTDVPADLTNVIAIAVGQAHTLALLPDGTVRAWGAGELFGPPATLDGGQSMVPAGLLNVVQIAAGADHSLALKADGTVAAWGSAAIYSDVWSDLGQSLVPAGLSNVVQIAGGDDYCLALKADGTVAFWGYSFNGENSVPSGLMGVVSIAAGWYHGLALKADHTLVAWGYDGFLETNVPPKLSNVASMAGGGFDNLALQTDGTVAGWGSDSSGQVNGAYGLTNVVAIAAGFDFTLALQSSTPIETPLVTLSLLPFGSQLQLTWSGGTLQSASNVAGPYTDVADVTSPLTFTPSEARQFYRVRTQQ